MFDSARRRSRLRTPGSDPDAGTSFHEIVLQVDRHGEGAWQVQVIQPKAGGCEPFEPPFSDEEIPRLWRALESRLHGAARHVVGVSETAEPADDGALTPEAIGERLYASLFRGEVRETWAQHRERAENAGHRLRLRLAFDPRTAAPLAALPWELLRKPRTAQEVASRVVLARVLRGGDAPRRLQVETPLKILVAVAAPEGVGDLDPDSEAGEIQQSLLGLAGRVRAVPFVARDLPSLRQKLQEGRFHGLHFIGHGEHDPHTGEGVLLFGQPGDPPRPVKATTLAKQLDDLRGRSLRLVVLNACRTLGGRAASLERDPAPGVATALVGQGMPAVVAMQLPVSNQAARIFSGRFYSELARGRAVDRAVFEARKGIRAELPETLEWVTPALYLQADEGRLFRIREAPAPRRSRGLGFGWPRSPLGRIAGTLAAALMTLGLLAWGLDPGKPYRTVLNPVACPSPAALPMRFEHVAAGEVTWPRAAEGATDAETHHVGALCVGIFEITRDQWHRVMTPDAPPPEHPDRPAEGVSYEDALVFVAALNKRTGGEWGFRLPTDAEWLWLALGNSGTLPYGLEPGVDVGELSDYANCGPIEGVPDDGFDHPAPVGSFKPHHHGLYDVIGNVSEWVQEPYLAEPENDSGTVPTDSRADDRERLAPSRALRRGGHHASTVSCRIDAPSLVDGTRGQAGAGLRLVFAPREPAE